MEVLFLNHKIINCGVYQYGKRIFDIIKNSNNISYTYYEIDSAEEYTNILFSKKDVKYIIYNYHGLTMNWLSSENISKTTINIGIIHESPLYLFDVVCNVDPDFCDDYEDKIYSLPRPIYENVDNMLQKYAYIDNEFRSFIEYKEDNTNTFGSFGFGFNNKGFDKIVSIINEQFDKAIIKFIIPVAYFDRKQYETILECKNKCISLNINPNIKLLFYHKFVTNEELLLFLRSNDANMFLYDKMLGRSISSCIDYALSVKKPLIISDSQMFKNIYDDIICIYKNNMDTCMSKSVEYCSKFLDEYSNTKLIDKFSKIIKLEEEADTSCNTNVLKIKSAFYYYENHNQTGDVTKHFKQLYNKYLTSLNEGDTSFVVNNSIFEDKALNIKKSLYVNVKINSCILTVVLNEHDRFDFDKFLLDAYKLAGINTINDIDIITGKEIKQFLCKQYYKNKKRAALIAMGEHIGNAMTNGELISNYCMYNEQEKYYYNSKQSILSNKNNNIAYISSYLNNEYPFFYKLMCNIHEKIVDITKSLNNLCIHDFNYTNTVNINIAKLKMSYDLYKYNKIKQRLIEYFDIFIAEKNQNIFNIANTKIICYISINDEEDIYNKISEINYLCLYYDILYFDTKYQSIIKKLFKNPNIYYDTQENIHLYINVIELIKYTIDEKDKTMFEFDPITYQSGGKLGDFINQLSIINENFYETGRKGILYIKELPLDCDVFTTGYINTYKDTYDIIVKQKYIFDYKIYNGEKTDIDLSSWRTCIDFNKNWQYNFKYHYHVNWGTHKWLSANANTDNKWKDTTVINITPYRFIGRNTINRMKTIIDNDIENVFCFISFDEESYNYFVNNTGITIPLYKLTSIEDTITILNSCKFAYLGLSSIQTMCNALHKQHTIFVDSYDGYHISNLKECFQHIIDIYFELL